MCINLVMVRMLSWIACGSQAGHVNIGEINSSDYIMGASGTMSATVLKNAERRINICGNVERAFVRILILFWENAKQGILGECTYSLVCILLPIIFRNCWQSTPAYHFK